MSTKDLDMLLDIHRFKSRLVCAKCNKQANDEDINLEAMEPSLNMVRIFQVVELNLEHLES